MLKFIVSRLIYAVPTLFGITLVAFIMLQFIPGDPARLLVGEDADEVVIESVRRDLGLDRPLPVQYLTFVTGVIQGDFGISFVTRQPVADQIVRRYPRTLALATSGIVFALVVGVTLGTIAALRPYSALDGLTVLVTLVGISIPGFWLGLMLIYLFSVQLRWLPMLGLASPQHLVLPTLTISIYAVALIARMTRANLIEVLQNDYVRTARSKGLRERTVIVVHALKNALMPVITIAGLSFGFMLGSAVIVEVVFSIDGIGRMIVDAIFARDIPVVQAGVLILAANFVVIMIALDIVHAYLDPRLRR